MTFDSLTFIAFFAIVLAVHYSPFPWAVRKVNLLVASYTFYAAWNPPYIVILWLSTLIDWTIAKAMFRTDSPSRRRLLLVATLAVNLGVLATFKYANFITGNIQELLGLVRIQVEVPQTSLILPIGISFYTFQSLSYTIDVYRGQVTPPRTMLDYALLVAFFPQLVAGPIIRAGKFLPQLTAPVGVDMPAIGWGAMLIVIGLFEKVVLSDYLLAPVADRVFDFHAPQAPSDAWAGMLAFSGQIFCDFSGYSLCAIGAARCLGFTIAENFRFPYAAIGFSDFWRRWHISLSSWLRDYLYVGLGGNRGGTPRTYRNLMMTMLIGGLWHGASWCFVFWGGLHGCFLVAERLWSRGGERWAANKRSMIWPKMLATFGVVTIAWVFFRARTIGSAFGILGSAFDATSMISPHLTASVKASVFLVVGALVLGQWLLRDSTLQEAARAQPPALRVLLLVAMLTAVVFAGGDSRAFIYFQF